MVRTQCKNDENRKFLTILVEVKDKGASKFNWTNLANIFNAQTDKQLSGKQLQNHYSELKLKFKAWEELQGLSGIAYNPKTKEVDVEEMNLERWNNYLMRNPTHGASVAKGELPNLDLMSKLFSGQSAHGVGGCFSPAMATKGSYLSKKSDKNAMLYEGSGDSDDPKNNDMNISVQQGEESRSPSRIVAQTSCKKRKSAEFVGHSQPKKRNNNFNEVVDMLETANPQTNVNKIAETLDEIGVQEKGGDDYFVEAMHCLEEGNRHYTFRALRNDNQKWIYLAKFIGLPPSY